MPEDVRDIALRLALLVAVGALMILGNWIVFDVISR